MVLGLMLVCLMDADVAGTCERSGLSKHLA